MSVEPPSHGYWADLRFMLKAGSLETAADAVDELIEQAARLGFTFELGTSGARAPVDPLGSR